MTLLERPHLVGLAHERDRTPAMFLPVQQAMATELAALGRTGADAALVLRGLQVHVVSSTLMARAATRNASHGTVDPDLWPDDWEDPDLVEALAVPGRLRRGLRVPDSPPSWRPFTGSSPPTTTD